MHVCDCRSLNLEGLMRSGQGTEVAGLHTRRCGVAPIGAGCGCTAVVGR